MWENQKSELRQSQDRFMAILSAIFILLFPLSTFASVPGPRIKPAPPAMSAFISESDAQILRKGLSAAKDDRWYEVERAAARINDPVGKDILRWIQATNDRNVPTNTLEYVHKSLSDWPRMVRVRAEAERRMFDESWTSKHVFEWFTGRVEPVSGEGRAALARAYYAKGCLLYKSPSPRDRTRSRMPSSA